MKLLLCIISLWATTCTFTQDFDWFDHKKNKKSDRFNPVLVSQPLTSAYPYASYDSSYARIRAPQYFKMINFPVISTQFTGMDIIFIIDSTTGACVYLSHQNQFTTAIGITRTSGGILQLNLRGSIVNGDTTLFLTPCFRRITLIDDTLRFYRSTTWDNLMDSLKVLYAGIIPDTTTNLTSRVIGIGNARFEKAEGLNNVISPGGTSNFNLYYIRAIFDGDTINDGNFNNGVIQRTAWNMRRWAGGNQHDFLTRELTDGYVGGNMAWNNYAPDRVVISRTDTCKYFPLPPTNTKGGGVTMWTTNGRQRQTVNDICQSPDSTKFGVIGTFNKLGTDSTASDSSYHFAIYDGLTDTWVVPDTGLDNNAFPFHSEWFIDTCIAISELRGSTRSLLLYNTETFTNYKVDMDTSILAFTPIYDTSIASIDGTRLVYTNPFTLQKTVQFVFPENKLDAIQAVGRNGDTLWCFLGRHLYKFHHEVLLDTYTLDTFTAVDKFTIGGLQYDGIRDAGDGGVIVFGNLKGLNGIQGNIFHISANGTITVIATVGGFTGDCDAYAPSCLEGAFTITATGMLNLGNGQYEFVGAFTTVNGVDIGGNAFLWHRLSGAQPLENNTTSYIAWEVIYYKSSSGFLRIAKCGDGRDWSGIMGNSLIGRYTDEEFRTLIPTPFVFTPPAEMDTSSYPPIITLSQWSPATRALTITNYYHIGFDGVQKSFTFSQTGTSLTNIDGVPHYTWNGTYNATDTVAPGDTVYCDSLVAIDNLGNRRDTTFNDFIFTSLDPEVSAWIIRVENDGGVLTETEINAVDAFMVDLKANNLRDTIVRLNVFAGDFTALKHPLIFNRDGSETPIGGAIDTLVNWLSADYNSRGLCDASNSTKYISTGVVPSAVSVMYQNSSHLCVYFGEYVYIGNAIWIGSELTTNDGYMANFTASCFASLNSLTANSVNPADADSGSYIAIRENATQQSLLKDGVVIIDNGANVSTGKPDWNIGIYARYRPASVDQFWRARLRFYSFGGGFTQAQAITYQGLINDLQTALGRNVY